MREKIKETSRTKVYLQVIYLHYQTYSRTTIYKVFLASCGSLQPKLVEENQICCS